MPITGYISIGLPLGPNAESDPVFVTDPQYGLGGLRTIGTTADRNSIVDARRQVGMIVYVSGDNTYYSLLGGTGNEHWTVLNGLTGNVTIPLATTGTSAGIASFDPDYFNVSLTAQVTVKTGIKAGNLIVLGVSSVFGAGETGSLPALDGSKLLEVNVKLLDGKTREQITDGGYFSS